MSQVVHMWSILKTDFSFYSELNNFTFTYNKTEVDNVDGVQPFMRDFIRSLGINY